MAVDGVEIGEGIGSCGTAAWRRQPVFTDDIASDPLWQDFLPLARQNGLAACWSIPILDADGSVLGTFAVYARRPSDAGAANALLATLVQTAAIAIRKKRDERPSKESERRWILALDAAGHGVWDWNLVTDRVFSRRAGNRCWVTNSARFGHAISEWSERVHPTTLPAAEAAIAGPPARRNRGLSQRTPHALQGRQLEVDTRPGHGGRTRCQRRCAARHRHAYRHQRLARQYRGTEQAAARRGAESEQHCRHRCEGHHRVCE